ncbi:MAG: hypothetical protein IPJ98_31110 [Bryobacterales bacterium]|nr:hypothetical protein [Bryobacterales bacterium]
MFQLAEWRVWNNGIQSLSDFCSQLNRRDARFHFDLEEQKSMRFHLRIDAVNLNSNAVGDCQQLSVLRGGGLLLLNAVAQIPIQARTWRDFPVLNRISGGSSSLLCWFEADQEDLPSMRTRLEEFLNSSGGELPTNIATFTIGFEPVREKKPFSVERTTALSRWAQMKSPSVAFPARGHRGVCEIDLVRPAMVDLGSLHGMASESVRSRFRYGRDQKHRFYEENAGATGIRFTDDIEKLAGDSGGQYGNLGDKIALIHMDGNGFGSIQRKCDAEAKLRDWDEFIQAKRKGALLSILNAIKLRPEWFNQDLLRLETLLWGGDEMVFVVPAWCGWSFLDAWFKCSRNWEFATPEGVSATLTHSASVVFCHHKAPIHRIKQLAISMTEMAKDAFRDRNHFAYMVLESFDHVGRDLEEHMKSLTHAMGVPRDLLLRADSMEMLTNSVARLKRGGFPKSQLVEIVSEIQKGSAYQDRVDRLELTTDAQSALGELLDAFGNSPIAWFHLVELWDYLPNPSALLEVQ